MMRTPAANRSKALRQAPPAVGAVLATIDRVHRLWLLVSIAACGKSPIQPSASAGSGSGPGSAPPVAPHVDANAVAATPPAAGGVAGVYQLDIPWPAIKCAVKPAAKQTVTISVEGDALQAVGTPWQVDEVRLNGTSTIYLRTYTRAPADPDHPYEQLLLLDIAGTQVTGKAELSQSPTGMGDDAPLCPPASAKVHGTRGAASVEPDCELVCKRAREWKSEVVEGLSESDCLKSCIRGYDQDEYYACIQRAADRDAARKCTSTLH
jgi:hypothetical protein